MQNKLKILDYGFENAVIKQFGLRRILFQCEHATNKLPNGLEWSLHDKEHFENTHWASDTGALKLAEYLAQKTEGVLVHSKYSRLYCDVNRMIQSSTLFRDRGDNKPIELNQGITIEEQNSRLSTHSSYYLALKNVIEQQQPEFIYSVHSFTPTYEGQQREVEVGILTSYFDEFGIEHQQQISKQNINCKINEPWSGKGGLNYALNTSCLSQSPNIQGTLIEVRNDLLLNQFEYIADIILNSILHVTSKQQIRTSDSI